MSHAVNNSFFNSRLSATADEVDDNFAVHRCLERRPVIFKARTQFPGIGQIAVVCQRDFPHRGVHGQGLNVTGIVGARCRIAHVTDADGAAFIGRQFLFKDRTD